VELWEGDPLGRCSASFISKYAIYTRPVGMK